MDYRIFTVRTVVNAGDCTRGCADTLRESSLKVDSGKQNPCRTGESNLRQRRAGPMLSPTELRPIPILARTYVFQLSSRYYLAFVYFCATQQTSPDVIFCG